MYSPFQNASFVKTLNTEVQMAQEGKSSNIYPVRVSLLVIAVLIAVICFGIIALLWITVDNNSSVIAEYGFIVGALIGVLAAGITGLVGLGASLAQTINTE